MPSFFDYFCFMYISLTGLKPKNVWRTIQFWRHAIPSYQQVQTAPGNLHYAVKKYNGYQCTITAWESREKMLEFMRSGAHLNAMKSFHTIATGRTYGYEAEQIPSWEEAFLLLEEKGKNY